MQLGNHDHQLDTRWIFFRVWLLWGGGGRTIFKGDYKRRLYYCRIIIIIIIIIIIVARMESEGDYAQGWTYVISASKAAGTFLIISAITIVI